MGRSEEEGAVVKRRIAIIGAGNGGQAFTAYFTREGHHVKLYDVFESTVEAIRAKGCIELTGAISETVPFEDVSTDLEETVRDAEIIVVINPSTYHRKIAASLAPVVRDGQIIFLNPGATFGSFAFRQALTDNGCTADVTIAESNILLFACRMQELGRVFIGAKKDRILVSAFPACRLDRIREIIRDLIPETEFVKNVLSTAIDNTNPTVHPMPTVFNIGWLESGEQFSFMQKAVSPTLSAYMERMDAERLSVGEKLGLKRDVDMFDLFRQYEAEYGVYGKKTLHEVFMACDAYTHIYGPKEIRTARYIVEDVGMGLVPLVSVGEMLGLDMSCSRLVIDICEKVLDLDFHSDDTCRNVSNLGLAGMTAEQIIQYAETGRKS